MDILSFYKYSEIEQFLFTKHTPLGYYIFQILAQNSFKIFAQNFTLNENVASLSIDDHNRSGYSHTAILNHNLKSQIITPCYGKLRAKNSVHYSGTSLEFRIKNPRNFIFKDVKEQSVILVDDIVTTGRTLLEAKKSVTGSDVLFALTLANAE